jgi:hypothetical protein
MKDDLKKNKKMEDDSLKEDNLNKNLNFFLLNSSKFSGKPFLGLAQLSKIFILL